MKLTTIVRLRRESAGEMAKYVPSESNPNPVKERLMVWKAVNSAIPASNPAHKMVRISRLRPRRTIPTRSSSESVRVPIQLPYFPSACAFANRLCSGGKISSTRVFPRQGRFLTNWERAGEKVEPTEGGGWKGFGTQQNHGVPTRVPA